MTSDMISNKKLNQIVTKLFIRGKKLNISTIFIKQFYFQVPNYVRLKYIQYLMKIPNKRELQQITFNHSSGIDFEGFVILYEKCSAKPYSFLVIDTTLALDNHLSFRKSLLKRIKKLIITSDNKIKDEKLQYDINKEAAKMLTLSSANTYQYRYFTGEEILASDQSQMIELAKFTYSPLGKVC